MPGQTVQEGFYDLSFLNPDKMECQVDFFVVDVTQFCQISHQGITGPPPQ